MRRLLTFLFILGFIENSVTQAQTLYLDQRPKVIVNSNDTLDFPWTGGFNSMMPVEIDVNLLQTIAKNTGGKYFRASSNSKLESIYKSINALETTEIEELKFYDYDEKYRLYIWIAVALLLIEFGLRNTIYRSFI